MPSSPAPPQAIPRSFYLVNRCAAVQPTYDNHTSLAFAWGHAVLFLALKNKGHTKKKNIDQCFILNSVSTQQSPTHRL